MSRGGPLSPRGEHWQPAGQARGPGHWQRPPGPAGAWGHHLPTWPWPWPRPVPRVGLLSQLYQGDESSQRAPAPRLVELIGRYGSKEARLGTAENSDSENLSAVVSMGPGPLSEQVPGPGPAARWLCLQARPSPARRYWSVPYHRRHKKSRRGRWAFTCGRARGGSESEIDRSQDPGA
jgi:hypothetical protein